MGLRCAPHGDEARSPEATRMIQPTRIDLTVPYARKEEAKALGARWDGDKRTWYAPPGTDLRHFDRRWLPQDLDAPTAPDPDPLTEAEPGKGVPLSELVAREKGVLDRGM